MITLLHGDNIEESRNAFVLLKNKSKDRELRDLSPAISDFTLLRQGLESHSFFGTDFLVVFENAITHFGRKEKSLGEFLEIIFENKSVDMLFFEGKEISKGTLQKFGPETRIQMFKLPVVLFSFLDALAPKNTRILLELYRKTVATNDPYLVFTMIVRRVHDLIAISENVSPDPSQTWQLARLTKQVKLFTIEKLHSMQRSLLSLDISNKSGLSALPLQASVELFLATL